MKFIDAFNKAKELLGNDISCFSLSYDVTAYKHTDKLKIECRIYNSKTAKIVTSNTWDDALDLLYLKLYPTKEPELTIDDSLEEL